MKPPGEESFWRLITLTGQAMRCYVDQRLKGYDLTVENIEKMSEK